jgi:hypothetical protein
VVGCGSRKVLGGVCVSGIAASVAVMPMLYELADRAGLVVGVRSQYPGIR